MGNSEVHGLSLSLEVGLPRSEQSVGAAHRPRSIPSFVFTGPHVFVRCFTCSDEVCCLFPLPLPSLTPLLGSGGVGVTIPSGEVVSDG